MTPVHVQAGIQELTARGSFKWSTFPGTIGAFIAEMDFGVAPAIAQALHTAVNDGAFGYLPHGLEDPMKEACAGWLRRAYGWEVAAEHVRPVPDVLRGLELMLEHFVEPGAPVVVPTPAYAPFLAIPRTLGREVVEVPMLPSPDGRWSFDETAIEAALAPRGGLLIVCNPYNPLGRVFSRDELLRLCGIVSRCGALVFSDEIHAPLVYRPHRHIPYATVSPEAAAHSMTALSASKAWNLPGLKCAQVVLTNPGHAARWDALGYFASRGASNLGVIANTAAYTAGHQWLDDALAYLDGNRRLFATLIRELLPGAIHHTPEATYLAWVDVRPLTTRTELATYLRERAGVSVTGGEECGTAGQGCFRFNFALPRPLLEQALHQLAPALHPPTT